MEVTSRTLTDAVSTVEFNKEFVQEVSSATAANIVSDFTTRIVAEGSSHFHDAAKAAATTFNAEIKASDAAEGISRKRKRGDSNVSEPESTKESTKLVEMMSLRFDTLEQTVEDSKQDLLLRLNSLEKSHMELKQDAEYLKSQLPVNSKSSTNDSEPKVEETKIEVRVKVKYIGKDHLRGTYVYNDTIMCEAAKIDNLRGLDVKATSKVLGPIKADLELDKSQDALPRVHRFMTITDDTDSQIIRSEEDYSKWLANNLQGKADTSRLFFKATLTDNEDLVKEWTTSGKRPLDALKLSKGTWFTVQADLRRGNY